MFGDRIVSTLVLATALAATTLAPASAKGGGAVVDIPYRDDNWQYLQVAHGGMPEFPAGDDSDFQGGQAGFGSTGHTCSWNKPGKVNTAWTPNTDMLLEHFLEFPPAGSGAYVSSLILQGTVDDSVDIYMNGQFVTHLDGGNCQPHTIKVQLKDYAQSGSNELEMRAIDNGTESFIDVKLTEKDGFQSGD